MTSPEKMREEALDREMAEYFGKRHDSINTDFARNIFVQAFCRGYAAAPPAQPAAIQTYPKRWTMCPETETPCSICPTERIPCEAATLAQPASASVARVEPSPGAGEAAQAGEMADDSSLETSEREARDACNCGPTCADAGPECRYLQSAAPPAQPAAAEVERLRAECDSIAELNHAQYLALENVRCLASRHRSTEWAQHLLRFCEEAGVRAVHFRQATGAAQPAAAVEPTRDEVPDGVWEALQRLIENGLMAGPASREDARLVSRYRLRALASPTQVAQAEPVALPARHGPGDQLPREAFADLVVQEACETEPADEDDPDTIKILVRDLRCAVLSAFLRYDAAASPPSSVQTEALRACEAMLVRQKWIPDGDAPESLLLRQIRTALSAAGARHE